jgi:hypothetical protein
MRGVASLTAPAPGAQLRPPSGRPLSRSDGNRRGGVRASLPGLVQEQHTLVGPATGAPGRASPHVDKAEPGSRQLPREIRPTSLVGAIGQPTDGRRTTSRSGKSVQPHIRS